MLIKKQTKFFKKWLLGLPYNVQIVVNDYIDRVQVGNTSNCEPVGKGVSEIKINFQKGYRIYYMIVQNNTILLLLVGGKKSGNQKVQQQDIAKAKNIRDYLKEKGEI